MGNKNLNKYKKLVQEALKELKTPGKRHKQIPNILTALRLFAPALIIPTALTGNIPLTIALAAGFGLTDLADGFIARHWKLTSELGKVLDALADKLYAGTLLIAASITNPLLLMNIGLELAIAGVNIYHELKGDNPKSSQAGKLKTWALFSLAGLGIAMPTMPALINGLSVLTAVMQGATISSYIKHPSNKEQPINPKEESYTAGKSADKTKEIVQAAELEKSKEIEKTTPTQEDLLVQLREYREFLQEEQNNQQIINNENISIQKQKK